MHILYIDLHNGVRYNILIIICKRETGLKVHSAYNQNMWNNFFVKLEQCKHLFLVTSICPAALSCPIFWSSVSWKTRPSCPRKNFSNFLGAFSKYTEWNLTYTENGQNETVHILRKRGKKLYAVAEYVELCKTLNRFALIVLIAQRKLCVFAGYMKVP